jgi:hypothetical protein
MDQPSLIVVGTGIRVIGQLTTESVAWIKVSDAVLYLAHDPVVAEIITEFNPHAESLAGFYEEGKPRQKTYEAMVSRVMESVRSGKKTCLAFYGHPGVFCWPGHEAIRQARREGYTAKMLPAISAEDCLFADLGLDPATSGCQSYEAMDFLKNGRRADPSSLLILWQIGVMGDPVYRAKGFDLSPLPVLVERLCRVYDPDHEVILYGAPIRWGDEPIIEHTPLGRLADVRLSSTLTLCIPPGQPTRPDVKVYKRFGIPLPAKGRPPRAPRKPKKRSRKKP